MDRSYRIRTRQPRYTTGAGKPIVVNVVSWQDARLDLTAAGDIHSGLGPDFHSHLVHLHEPDLAPLPERGVHQLVRSGEGLSDQLERLFRTLRPDIVQTHRMSEFESVAPAAQRAGVPNLIHCFEATIGMNSSAENRRHLLSLRQAGALAVVPSSDFSSGLWTDVPLQVIRPGIDCRRFTPGDAGPARRKVGLPVEPRILGCGSPSASLDPLIQAMFRSQPEIHLALFGPAIPTSQQRHRIRRLGLDERIHVLGPWAEPDLIYRAVDAYLHGPDNIPLPRQVLAAQASGKPVIATRPVREEALCPTDGYLLPTLFVPALTSAIRRAISGGPGESVREFAETHWSTGAMVGAYRDLFLTLAARPDEAVSSTSRRTADGAAGA